LFSQATGANSNTKMAALEVPVDGSQRTVQWVCATRVGGANVDESSLADGRDVTPLQGAFFLELRLFFQS